LIERHRFAMTRDRMTAGFHTQAEIVTQPAAWQQAIDVSLALRPQLEALLGDHGRDVVFTGCGSTYYLSLAAAALFQERTGRRARAVPAGELVMNPSAAIAEAETLLVAVSRSGSTSETIRAVELFQARGLGPVLVVTNNPEAPLAAMGAVTVAIPAGREVSVAQTRSFASMYVAAVCLALMAAGDRAGLSSMAALPEAGERLIATYDSLARHIGEDLDLDRFYFLGSGARYGLACEVNLKLKEMSRTHSEPFHFLEFRHGPMSMVTDKTLIVGLRSDGARGLEQGVLDEMQSLGARVVSLGESGTTVAFESGLDEQARGVLYLPVLQLMAMYRSLAKGDDPDRPRNLPAVVELAL
jgi:glucosamine--fructose-6-phosphate aminotransferase (isomerizing)